MKIDVEAARLLTHRAAQGADEGLPSLLDTSVAMCFANEAVRRVVANGAQVMGRQHHRRADRPPVFAALRRIQGVQRCVQTVISASPTSS
ncbi:MAG: acyl-CoA dehydrogenase family protein [Burkholderiales bacterium]|nr:acyl-CoA dehydrogenase family protein [Burkholderiales bacterium]